MERGGTPVGGRSRSGSGGGSAAGRGDDAPRRGLVLGAGGVLGAAWTIGALTALARADRVHPATCEVIVGTSAGSVLAALLGAGVDVAELHANQLGGRVSTGPLAGYSYDHDRGTGGALPGLPRPGVGSGRLLLRSLRHPRSVPPLVAWSSLLPTGRGSLWGVRHLVDAVTPAGQWSQHPGVWVVATDYDHGRRVAFGQPGAPVAELSEAVLASCSIPAWYPPVTIGGHRYVDGGTFSPTSLDLVADLGLDEVVVLAPMCSFEYDRPASVAGRLERSFRRTVTRRMLREAEAVRASGTRVSVLCPGAEDLAGIGSNLMDPTRRRAVLETSVRTSADALHRFDEDQMSWTA